MMRKSLYLANPYGFSSQQRDGPLKELCKALSDAGANVWEPFERNNQIDRTQHGWAKTPTRPCAIGHDEEGVQ